VILEHKPKPEEVVLKIIARVSCVFSSRKVRRPKTDWAFRVMWFPLKFALELARTGHKVFATMRNPESAPTLGEIAAREGLLIETPVQSAYSQIARFAGRSVIHRGRMRLRSGAGAAMTDKTNGLTRTRRKTRRGTSAFKTISG
jgi:hypothetical protein